MCRFSAGREVRVFSRARVAHVVLVVCALLPRPAFAQGATATLAGVVRDPQALVVPGVAAGRAYECVEGRGLSPLA